VGNVFTGLEKVIEDLYFIGITYETVGDQSVFVFVSPLHEVCVSHLFEQN